MNKKALSNLIALGEGFTTEFKRSGASGLISAGSPFSHSRRVSLLSFPQGLPSALPASFPFCHSRKF